MGARIGETVQVALAGFRAQSLKIVGTAVFPTLDDALSLGKGAALTVGGLRRLLPPGVPAPPLDTLLLRFRPSAVAGRAGLDRLAAREARLGSCVTIGPATPTDVVNFGRVQNLPLLLGTALSLLALLTITHLLLTSVRRRRRDFAVLRSLGFTRRQVRGAVSWQASALTGAALCLGIPAGILGGRVAWRLFAAQLGILPAAAGTGNDAVWATPAFYRQHHAGLGAFPAGAFRLRHGLADLPAFQREVSRMGHGKVVQSYPLAEQAVNTERSIHLQAVALWLVCGLLAVIGLLVLGQLLARLSFLDSAEYGTLLALGMSRRALLAVGFGRAAAIGAAGGACGAVLAVLASPALPVGLAGVAEPYPGMHADGSVLGLGVAGTVLATMAAAAWPAWRAAWSGPGAGEGRGRGNGRARGAHGRGPRLAAARDRGHQLGDRFDRPAARAAAGSGPDGTARAQHDRQRGRRRRRAHRGRGLLRQPGKPARHAAAVRRHLGRLREQPGGWRRQPGRPRRR